MKTNRNPQNNQGQKTSVPEAYNKKQKYRYSLLESVLQGKVFENIGPGKRRTDQNPKNAAWAKLNRAYPHRIHNKVDGVATTIVKIRNSPKEKCRYNRVEKNLKILTVNYNYMQITITILH